MLKFADGMGYYTALLSKWTETFQVNIVNGGGRGGRNAIQITSGGFITKSLPYSGTWFVGFAGQCDAASNGVMYQLATINTGGGNVSLMTCTIETDNSISLRVGSQTGPVLGNTGTLATPFYISEGVFYYFEISVVLGGSTPVTVTATLKVNSVTLLNSLSGNTTVNSNQLMVNSAQANYHFFGTGIAWLADVYINDNVTVTGQALASTFRGDVSVGPYLVPRADNTTLWTPSAGPPSFACVDSVPPNFTKNINSNTVTQITDFFLTTVAPLTGQIQACHMCVTASKNNEGTRAISPTVAGAVQAGAPTWYVSDQTYQLLYPMDVDPSTGSVWTVAIVNAQVFGVDLVV